MDEDLDLMNEMMDRFESLMEDEGKTEEEALAIVAEEFPDQVELLAELIPDAMDEDGEDVVGLVLIDDEGDEE